MAKAKGTAAGQAHGPAGAEHPLPPLGEPLRLGRYRHYKGGLYEVLGLVRHSETCAVHVLYRALYGERGLWVRPRDMFEQTVQVDGVSVPRFAWLDADDGPLDAL